MFCQNGATCINTFDGFTCNCASGYTGVTCEAQITCTETSCPDGQMCMDTVDGFDCLVTQNVTVNTTNEQSAENVANTAGNEGMVRIYRNYNFSPILTYFILKLCQYIYTHSKLPS